jgi:pimeloyl-ACP methyl ester carboxylesterase
MKHKTSFSQLEKIDINGSTQWVLVKGRSTNAPLLIHVQAGPGLPMISEAEEMERLLRLENHFLVAYWDQRGCGISYDKTIPTESFNLDQMARDIVSCAKYLSDKYHQRKAVLVGYSMGATTSLMAAAMDSSLFSAVFAAGTDVDISYANHYALEFASKKAAERKNKKLLQKISELKRNPIEESSSFRQRAEILTNLGGIKNGSSYNRLLLASVKNMLFSKYYGIGGLIKTLKGMTLCIDTLLPEFNNLNLFDKVPGLTVPVHFIQGNLDAIAPPDKGREYFEHLKAAKKSFSLFENSAHMPHYEEPEKFSGLILSHLLTNQ